jgi:MFS family permease
MVRDFHIAEEKSVGYYVGAITSCFALSQLLTGIDMSEHHSLTCILIKICLIKKIKGIHWGMLSDRIGRRPVILQGLIGTISSILLFGLSKSFIWALLSRSLCGLLVSIS